MVSQRKEFFLSLLLIAVVLVLLIADHQFFLKNLESDSMAGRTPEEYNAYLIRHHQFDSVILGSSMSMCFKCSDFDRITGGFSYKLPLAGCEVPVWVAMADYICGKHEIKAILADLHETLLMLPPANMQWIEDYYCDKNRMTEIRNGASLKSISTRLQFFSRKFQKDAPADTPFSRDDLYNWSKEYPCGKIYLARNLVRHPPEPDPNRDLACVKSNLEPLITFLKAHPEIRFYLYLPPYSVLAYDDPEQFVSTRKIVMDLLLPFPNVALYDFQAAACVTDFGNYKDLTHFSQEISAWMLRQMATENYRVTPANRAEFEKRFAEVVLAFDRQGAIAELTAFYAAHKTGK